MTDYIVSFIDCDSAHRTARIEAESTSEAELVVCREYRLGIQGSILGTRPLADATLTERWIHGEHAAGLLAEADARLTAQRS